MTAYVNAFLWGTKVRLVRRLPNGKLGMHEAPADYVSYIRPEDKHPFDPKGMTADEIRQARDVIATMSDIDNLRRSLANSSRVRGVGIEDNGYWRIRWLDWESRKGGTEWLKSQGLVVYEGDVNPVRRLIADHSSIEVQKPKRVYLDIEADSRVPFSEKQRARVLCWSLVDDDENLVGLGVLEEDSTSDERRLLAELMTCLGDWDQVLAWNGDGYDFEVLDARYERAGLDEWKQERRRLLRLDHMLVFDRHDTSAESGEEKASLALDAVAAAKGIGEGKMKTPAFVKERFGDKPLGALSWHLWAAGGEFRKLLVDYMIQDTKLMPRLEKKTGYIALQQAICEACHLFADTRAIQPTAFMDGYMLRMGAELGYHFGTKPERMPGVERQKYAGAFVLQPTAKGIEHDVHVADFKSLYPTIIRTWNMSPETKRGNKVAPGIGECRSVTGVCFDQTEIGMLPRAVAEMMHLRDKWKDAKSAAEPGSAEELDAERKSKAYKVAANSFYGVMGAPDSRYFDVDVAEGITQCGAWLIKQTFAVAEKRGMRVIYGDTDSSMIADASSEAFADFIDHCNTQLYPTLLAGCGCKRNDILLAYDKAFTRIVFPMGKDGQPTAKRYVAKVLHTGKKKGGGWNYAGAKAKPEIKGVEYKRGDTNKLTRDLQRAVIDILVGEHEPKAEDFKTLLDAWHKRLVDGELTLEEVVFSKCLTKEIEEYKVRAKVDGGTTEPPAHVRVAKMLRERGEDVSVGTRIAFVVVDGSASPAKVVPAADYQNNVDRRFIWNRLIYPASQRVLMGAFPHADWSSWLLPKLKAAPKNQMPLFHENVAGKILGPAHKSQ